MSDAAYIKSLFESGKITEERYLDLVNMKAVSDNFVNHEIDALSGFKGGKKVVIVDTDNDQDLSDEIVFEYDTAFSSLTERLASYEKHTLRRRY